MGQVIRHTLNGRNGAALIVALIAAVVVVAVIVSSNGVPSANGQSAGASNATGESAYSQIPCKLDRSQALKILPYLHAHHLAVSAANLKLACKAVGAH